MPWIWRTVSTRVGRLPTSSSARILNHLTYLPIELYGQDIEEIAEQETDKTKDEIESAMESGESKWQFEICDTLTNTGPIVSMDIGQRASTVRLYQ